MGNPKRPVGALVAAILAAALAGCDRKPAQPRGAPARVEAGVVTLASARVVLTRELPGRTAPFRVAEVRARVNGIVLKRLFVEGSDVKEGQRLFEIDPAPYRAALDAARAQLARAEASVASARLQAQRYAPLAAQAVSQQDLDNALAAQRALEADVAAGRAAVDLASIQLGYTTVRSPLSGRIGRAAVTEGAYVQQAQATLLATVQQLDPSYVDLTQPSGDVLRLRRELEAGRLRPSAAPAIPVRVVLEDGTEHPLPGRLQFSDVTVDPGTGSITLRAIVPNPRGELLPGMFVRARVELGVRPDAILVPQVGVTRDARGEPTVLIVNAEGKAELRRIKADQAIGEAWLVTDGLRAGDQVIVDNLQRIRPGSDVTPVPVAPKRSPANGPTTAAAAVDQR